MEPDRTEIGVTRPSMLVDTETDQLIHDQEILHNYPKDELIILPIYGLIGWSKLIMGISAMPKYVEYRSKKTGKVIARTRKREVLMRFK